MCRAVSPVPVASCQQRVGQVAPVVPTPPRRGQRKGPPAPQSQFTDTIPQTLQEANATAFAEYGVLAENSRGRSVGLSNQVRVPLAPVLLPAKVEAQVTGDGIVIRWCFGTAFSNPNLSYGARVYRQELGGTAPAVAVLGDPVPARGNGCAVAGGLLDQSFAWEKKYSYRVAGLTRVMQNGQVTAEVEGDDSEPVSVFAHDVFPPAVPSGLEAVASGIGQRPFIDLTWSPVTAADLAGYNVYRQEQGKWVKLNPVPLPVPSFRDEPVAAGQSYTYVVTSVDVRGNESHRSQPASEKLP